MRFGAYHFARPGGSGDAALVANAIAQADLFLDVAQPQPGELPPVLDLEAKGGLAPAALQTWTSAWLDQVAARTGVKALVYSSPNFWKTALGDTTGVADGGNPLWVAHWTTNARAARPGRRTGAGRAGRSGSARTRRACPASRIAVDGDRFRGADPSAAAIPPYPAGSPAPSAAADDRRRGADRQDARRRAGHAGAAASRLSFAYQWQRCDAAGAGCLPIVGRDGGDLSSR